MLAEKVLGGATTVFATQHLFAAEMIFACNFAMKRVLSAPNSTLGVKGAGSKSF